VRPEKDSPTKIKSSKDLPWEKVHKHGWRDPEKKKKSTGKKTSKKEHYENLSEKEQKGEKESTPAQKGGHPKTGNVVKPPSVGYAGFKGSKGKPRILRKSLNNNPSFWREITKKGPQTQTIRATP